MPSPKHYILTAILIFLLPYCLFAQKDSLDAVWMSEKTPAAKLERLNAFAKQYRIKAPEWGRDFAWKAIGFGNQLKDEKAKGFAFNQIGVSHYIHGKYDSAIFYFEASLQSGKLANDSAGVGGAYNNLGNAHLNLGKYVDALEYFLKAKEIREKMEDYRRLYGVINNIGNIYFYQGIYDKALEEYVAALRMAEKSNNLRGVANTLSNIGVIYERQGENEEALSYHQRSYSLRKELADMRGQGISLNNIGLIYSELKQTDSALYYYQTAGKIFESLNDAFSLATLHNYIGEAYLAQVSLKADSAKLPLATEEFRTALSLFRQMENPHSMAYAQTMLGKALNTQGKYRSALLELDSARRRAQEVGSLDWEMYATLYSADAHEELGEYDTAFKLLEKYIALKDSIFNAEKSEQSARFKILYQTEKKERELALLSKESEIQRLEIQRQRNVAAQRQAKLALLSKEQELERLRFLQEKAAQAAQLKGERQKRELDSLDFLRREEEKQAQISLLEKDQRLKEAALARNQLILFAGGGFLILLLLLVGLVWRNLQQKRRANRELLEKNEEINQQKEEISIIAENLRGANTTITKANQKITSSINYAQRIQQAILPTAEEFKAAFPVSFVLYEPKDIVSGDFYWLQRFENQTLLAAIDCTGHGVPGAFMSVIANDLFRESAQKLETENKLRTDNLLAIVHEMLQQTLHQGNKNTVSDGMDVAVIQHYPKEKKVYFSGAKNPLLVQRGDTLEQIKGDRIALGGSKHTRQERKFTVHEIKIEEPTWFYMYSDGLQDQFGGPQNRKLGKKRLMSLLNEHLNESEEKQLEKLRDYLQAWQTQSQEPQTDDQLLIGVRVEKN